MIRSHFSRFHTFFRHLWCSYRELILSNSCPFNGSVRCEGFAMYMMMGFLSRKIVNPKLIKSDMAHSKNRIKWNENLTQFLHSFWIKKRVDQWSKWGWNQTIERVLLFDSILMFFKLANENVRFKFLLVNENLISKFWPDFHIFRLMGA